MKAIIAGGRSYRLTPADIACLDALRPIITEVVSGHCTDKDGNVCGADGDGEAWAERNSIPIKLFPADWRMGLRAGPVRNKEMALYVRKNGGGCLIAFPGHKGTANMVKEAGHAGLYIYGWHEKGTLGSECYTI